MDTLSKRKIRDIIRLNVSNYKHLSEIKTLLSEYSNEANDDYIDEKFMKYCLIYTCDDIRLTLYGNSILLQNLKDFVADLDNPTNLFESPNDIFSSSQYAKLLLTAVPLLSEEKQQYMCSSLKTKILNELVEAGNALVQASSLLSSSKLLDTFSEFLTDFKTQFLLPDPNFLENLSNGNTSSNVDKDWEGFQILYSKDAERLSKHHQQTVDKLVEEFSKFGTLTAEQEQTLLSTFNKTRTPPKVDVKFINDRGVVEVTQPILVLSKCLPLVEEKLKLHKDIERVEFCAEYTFYINASLEKKLWHGINVQVVSDKIHCVSNKLHWDISGLNKNISDQGKANSANIAGQDGCNGEDGFPGESGGNILMIAKTFCEINKLLILTNGGDGSHGQHGGDGKEGEDGRNGNHLSLADFTETFQSPVFSYYSDENKIKKAIHFLRANSESIDIKTNKMSQQGDKTGSDATDRYIYCSGKLNTGITYEYCFSESGGSTYVLLTGEPGTAGKPGGSGGVGGKGGQGGYPGTVQLFKSNKTEHNEDYPQMRACSGKSGNGGRRGSDGKSGVSGLSGHDVGMIAYYLWKKPVYYSGEKFRLRTLESSKSVSVWCQHFKKYREISTVPTKRASVLVTATDGTQVTTSQVVAVKKSAINLTNAFHNAENFESIQMSTANDVASSGQSWNEMTSLARNRLEHIRSAEISKTKLVDVHIRPLEGMHQFMQTQPEEDFATSLQNLLANKTPDLKAQRVLENYKFKFEENSTWESRLLQIPTQSGANSFFHALYGEQFFGTLSLDMNQVKQKRLEAVEKLLDAIADSCPNELKVDLINTFENLTNVSRHPYLGQDLLDGFEDIKSHLSERVHMDSESVDLNFVKVLNKLKLIKNKNAQKILQEVLINDSIHLNTHEASLLAKVGNIDLKIFENQNKSLAYVSHEDMDICALQSFKLVALDSALNFSRVEPAAIRNWKNLEQWLDTLEFADISLEQDNNAESCGIDDNQPTFESSLLFWPKKYAIIFQQTILQNKPINLHEIRAVQLMYQELSVAIFTNSDVFPLLHILLSFPCSHWPAELCLHILQTNMTQKFPDCKVASETIEEYRTLFSKFPSNLIFHLVSLLKQSVSKYANEFINPILKIELMELYKYGPFDFKMSYDELKGMASISQWHQQLSKMHCMGRLEKSIPHFLKTNEPNQTSELFYYYYSLVDKFPKLDEFLKLCNDKSSRQSNETWTVEKIAGILGKFHSGRWTLDDSAINILMVSDSPITFAKSMDNQVTSNQSRRLHELSNIINADSQTDVSKTQLNLLIEIAKEYIITRNLELLEICEENLTSWAGELKQKIKSKQHLTDQRENANVHLVCEVLQQIEYAIYSEFRHKLYDTQKLSILAAASYTLSLFSSSCEAEASEAEQNLKNLLIQVSTGEGKSYVVLALAIIRGLFGLRSDVITSSSVLAERDCRKFQKIFKIFDISAGTITTEDYQQRAVQYQKTVVYGEVSQFQRDYLIDHFYNQNTRGDRQFEGLIIDEVDNMFLDKGNNVLYLSHHPASLEALERIFMCIWQTTVQMLNKNEYSPLEIYDSILSSIKPVLKKQNLEKFDNSEEIWQTLINSGLINANGVVLDANPTKLIHADLELSTATILGLLTGMKETLHSAELFISNHLSGFIELHLLDWIKSAYQATLMEEGIQYVLHANRFSLDNDKHEKILIIDLDTGTDLEDSHWGDGLHQFLQLKHGCKLAPASLKSVFISNITYFNLYTNMVGLTGTLGSNYERHFLKETYKVNFLVVPTSFPSNFIEEEPIVCENQNKWMELICKDLAEKLENSRSVLVICESIKNANRVYDYIRQQKTKHQIILYRRDSEHCEIATSKDVLKSGVILISTNLAGRGTDIKLSKGLADAGGLHVILSYLPNNSRVRWQGMGRAGRCGKKGSGRLIFCVETKTQQHQPSPIDYINEKEAEEQGRISEILRYYNTVIRCEEEKFSEFKQKFNLVRRKLEEVYTNYKQTNSEEDDVLLGGSNQDIKQIVLQNMLAEWTFWLDKFSTHLRITQPRKQLSLLEHQFCKQEHSNLLSEFAAKFQKYEHIQSSPKRSKLQSVVEFFFGSGDSINGKQVLPLISDTSMAVKVALLYLKSKKCKQAITILEEVVTKNQDTSMPSIAAKYYLILAKLMQTPPKEQKNLTREIFNVLGLLYKHYEFQAEFPKAVLGNTVVNQQQVEIREGLVSQKTAQSGLLATYINSLTKVVGKMDIQPEDFLDLVNNDVVEATVLHRKLLHASILEYPRYTELDEPETCQPLQMLANKSQAKLDSYGLTTRSFVAQKDLVNDNYKEYTKAKRRIKGRFHGISSKGFLKEIHSAIQIQAKFLVINKQKPNNSNSVNELKDWLKNLNIQGQTINLTTSNLNLVNFDGEVFLASRQTDNLYQLVCKDTHVATHEIVAAVNVQQLQNLKIENYSSLLLKDFTEICSIDNRTSSFLYEELKLAEVIDENGHLQTTRILEAIQNQENYQEKSLFRVLPENMQSKVLELIVAKCAYQYEKLRLLTTIENETPCIPINLPKSSLERFLSQAYSNYLLEGITVHPDKVLGDSYDTLPMSQQSLLDKFSFNFQSEKTLDIKDISILFPSITPPKAQEIKTLLTKYGIIDAQGIVLIDVENFPNFQNIKDEATFHILKSVYCFLSISQKLENKEFIYQLRERLKALRGYIHLNEDSEYKPESINIEEFAPQNRLADYFQERYHLRSLGLDCKIGYSNRFTTKMLIKATGVFVFGAGQVFAGAMLAYTGFGLGVGSVTVATGVNDIVYSLKAFRSGRFSWEDYAKVKTITTITAIGCVGVAHMTAYFISGASPLSLSIFNLPQFTQSEYFAKFLKLAGGPMLNFIQKGEICKRACQMLGTVVDWVLLKLIDYIMVGAKKKVVSYQELSSVLKNLAQLSDLNAIKEKIEEGSKSAVVVLTKFETFQMNVFKQAKPYCESGTIKALEMLEKEKTKVLNVEVSEVAKMSSSIVGPMFEAGEILMQLQTILENVDKYLSKLVELLAIQVANLKTEANSDSNDVIQSARVITESQQIIVLDIRNAIQSTCFEKVKAQLVQKGEAQLKVIHDKAFEKVQKVLQPEEQNTNPDEKANDVELSSTEEEINRRRLQNFQTTENSDSNE